MIGYLIGLIAVVALVLSIICMTRCKTDKFGQEWCTYGPYSVLLNVNNPPSPCGLKPGTDDNDEANTLCCGHFTGGLSNYYFCDPLGKGAADKNRCEGW